MRLVYPALLFVLLCAFCTAGAAQSIVMPANLTVAPEATVNISVSLSTPAPPGGVTLSLTSDNPAVASIWPPNLVIPMEMTTAPRLTSTITGHLTGTVSIRVSGPGYTTGVVVVQVASGGTPNPGTGTMSLKPANLSITGTATQNLTVVLSGPAPSGGVSVRLSCSHPVATTPATVNINSGMTTATVPVTGVTPGAATITASAGNFGSANAALVVQAAGGGTPGLPAIIVPSSITLTPGDVRELPIELATPAPAGGVSITAASSNTSAVNLSQTSIYIPDGMTSVPRKVTTITALGSGAATITVSAPGYASASTQVQVTGGTPLPGGGTMSFSPANLSLSGTETKTLTLSLSNSAGTGGLSVNLSSSNASVASLPSTINIAAGTAVYNVPVTGVAAGTASITATAANYGSAGANVTVSSSGGTPPPPPSGAAVVVPSTLTLYPGDTTVFTVALPSGAGSNGVPVTLTSSDSSKVSVSPTSFVIPEGATIARRVEVIVRAVAVGSAVITASATGYANGNSQVQVKSAVPGGTMSLSPAALNLVSGSVQNLTLALAGTLPPNGLVVYLASSNTSAASVPASVTVPSGATSILVQVTGVGSGAATITATAANFGSATATVNGSSTAQINLPSNVTLGVGETVTFPVTLSAAAASDAVITLNSSDTSKLVVAPSSVIIRAGMSSAPNVTTTVRGISAGTATVTATSPGLAIGSKQVIVTATTPPPSQLTMGLSPSNLSITGFITQNLTLTFSGPTPAAGLSITVRSSNGAVASVASPLQVPYNTTSIPVPVTALSAGSTVITVSAPGMQDATATVTVSAPGLGSISMPGSWSVPPNQSNTMQVSLTPAAPVGGLTLTFSSSNASKVTTTPTTVAVAGGATTATVQVNGVAAGNANLSVSAPGYTGATTQVQVFSATGSGAFIPGILALNSGITDTVFLSLGPQSPAGLTVSLFSSNPAIAKVPATVVVPANAYGVSVPVTGMAGGKATVTATVAGYITTALNITVLSMDGVSVQWHGVCWAEFIDPVNGGFIWRHAMDFNLLTPSPVTVQASLFYTSSDCTGVVDNMNDFDSPTSAGHIIQGFLNYPYPYYKTASALFWIGSRTIDGKCQPGSPCSGCMAYTEKTPMCDQMP